MLQQLIKNKKKVASAVLSITVLVSLGVAFAAFQDKGKVLGSTFSVGSSDIKLLSDVGGTVEPENLDDEINGPDFTNITPNWTEDYLVKVVNKGTSKLELATHAKYLTANDPEDLRNIIYVEPVEWTDLNGNGHVDEGETGFSLGRKTIVKWNTEGFDLGIIEIDEVRGWVLRFSTDSVSDSKQGATAIFDFEIDAIGL